jgi:hypothetical protein
MVRAPESGAHQTSGHSATYCGKRSCARQETSARISCAGPTCAAALRRNSRRANDYRPARAP